MYSIEFEITNAIFALPPKKILLDFNQIILQIRSDVLMTSTVARAWTPRPTGVEGTGKPTVGTDTKESSRGEGVQRSMSTGSHTLSSETPSTCSETFSVATTHFKTSWIVSTYSEIHVLPSTSLSNMRNPNLKLIDLVT